MRKLILAPVIIFICALNASAQIRKGAIFIGGNISFINYENESPSVTNEESNFNISPVIGFAIKENLVTGLTLTYFTGKSSETPAGSTTKTNGGGAGAFLRKYYRIKTSDFSVFLHGELKAIFGKSEYKNPTSSYKSETAEIPLTLQPGISFRLKNAVHLEAGLNSFLSIFYRNTETRQNSSTFVNNTFGASLNVFNVSEHLYFGIRIFLNN